MSEFQKGLIVGMLIIIGCGTFIASSSNDDVGRYVIHKTFGLLDTKTGAYYYSNFSDEDWHLQKSVKPYKLIPQ